METKLRFT